jgi:hypothetical protein
MAHATSARILRAAALITAAALAVPGVAGCGPQVDQTAYGSPVRDGVGDGTVEEDERLTAFDIDHPAIDNLDPELLSAVQQAATAAQQEGIELLVNSGWRSAELQEQLLQDAVATYGSVEEARRWVSTPDESRHVTGDAVDVGLWDAADWLDVHGNAWGLCRIYDNEPWHFELAVEPDGTCPRLLFDATEG